MCSTGQEESDGDDSVKDPTCYDRSDSSIKQTESGTPVLRRLTNNSIGVKSVNSEHRIGTRNDLMNVLAEKKRNDEATNTFLVVKRCCRETKNLIAYYALEFCTRKQSYGTYDLDISHHLVASSQALIGLYDESQQNGVPFHYFASETTAIECDNYFSVINKDSAECDELLRITDGVDLDRAYQKSMEQEKDASRNSCQSTVGVGSQNLTLRDKDGVTRPRAKNNVDSEWVRLMIALSLVGKLLYPSNEHFNEHTNLDTPASRIARDMAKEAGLPDEEADKLKIQCMTVLNNPLAVDEDEEKLNPSLATAHVDKNNGQKPPNNFLFAVSGTVVKKGKAVRVGCLGFNRKVGEDYDVRSDRFRTLRTIVNMHCDLFPEERKTFGSQKIQEFANKLSTNSGKLIIPANLNMHLCESAHVHAILQLSKEHNLSTLDVFELALTAIAFNGASKLYDQCCLYNKFGLPEKKSPHDNYFCK